MPVIDLSFALVGTTFLVAADCRYGRSLAKPRTRYPARDGRIRPR